MFLANCQYLLILVWASIRLHTIAQLILHALQCCNLYFFRAIISQPFAAEASVCLCTPVSHVLLPVPEGYVIRYLRSRLFWTWKIHHPNVRCCVLYVMLCFFFIEPFARTPLKFVAIWLAGRGLRLGDPYIWMVSLGHGYDREDLYCMTPPPCPLEITILKNTINSKLLLSCHHWSVRGLQYLFHYGITDL